MNEKENETIGQREPELLQKIQELERKNRILQEGIQQSERIREQWGRAVEDLKLTRAELRSTNENLSLLYKVSSTVSHTLDSAELYSDILNLLPEIFGTPDLSWRGILLVSRGSLNLAASVSENRNVTLPRTPINPDACDAWKNALNGGCGEGENCSSSCEVARALEVSSPACCSYFPLKANGEVIGLCYCFLKEKTEPAGDQKNRLLSAVGEQLGIAIENVRLFEEKKTLSLHDPLTGLANRRYLDIILDRSFSTAKRYSTPLSVAMLDIDYFKKYNDEHGHQAGDRLLSVTANIISHQIRESDMAARFGGEEFIVVLPETAILQAKLVMERLRAVIGERTGVTISIGVAEMDGGVMDSATLIERADAALYRAKEKGRNRVEVTLREFT